MKRLRRPGWGGGGVGEADEAALRYGGNKVVNRMLICHSARSPNTGYAHLSL
ncbi:MAG: hypothetical protein OSJ83_11390 [Clostridia bacterium]|nr:hypothetical protein [Clostridia bacterium]